MLSVLITTYNYFTFPLIKTIHKQLLKIQIDFEIICIDDGSKSSINIENKQISTLVNARFKTLPKNIGRSALRNLLVKKAQYDWLLFLDGDVMPTSTNFISKYINCINKESLLFCGGIQYNDEENTQLLRWKIGKKSEEIPSVERQKEPYKYFFTSNFLCKKTIFNKVQFSEKLTKYGYEDLLFSLDLKKYTLKIEHINNPAFHLGIDTNEQFIEKTKSALKNLIYLIKRNQIKKEDTKITFLFFRLKKIGITTLFYQFLSFFEEKAVKKSSSFYFQLFRLGYLHQVIKNQK